MWRCLHLLVAVSLFGYSQADTPANCSYGAVKGKWTFYIGQGGHDNLLKCDDEFDVVEELVVDLAYPDVATVAGEPGAGFWTMVFNQGFEVAMGQRKFFAFSNYTGKVSHCFSTLNGWAHDVSGKNWSCYYGVKRAASQQNYVSAQTVENHLEWGRRFQYAGSMDERVEETRQEFDLDLDRKYVKNLNFVQRINRATKRWHATHYPQFEGLTLRVRQLMAGGGGVLLENQSPVGRGDNHHTKLRRRSMSDQETMKRRSKDSKKRFLQAAEVNMHDESSVTPVSSRKLLSLEELPKSFDWRDVDGVDYVPPVTSQGDCGSCYAVATASMLYSRFMIQSDGKIQKVFSPQDVVSCSEYSQGCMGGFPYLIGKYADDFGLVEESCFPYVGKDLECKEMDSKCRRYYVKDYHYIGGYYGACSEELMRLELVNHGPIAVGYDVAGSFFNYRKGIYSHIQDAEDELNQWRPVNHAVLVVGYGEEEDGYKYWIAQNSWGKFWGENGFFRIVRGVNELNFETIAVAASPVL